MCSSDLHHMSRIFRDNSMPPRNPAGIRIDSKRRKRLTEKRMAMGHKADDHEEQVSYANRVDLERNLPQLSEPEEMDESRGYAVSSRGGIAHTPAQERAVKRGKQMKTFGEEER